MYDYFFDDKLISQNHSRFKHRASCINQLIYVTNNIWSLPNEDLEGGAFLDISKTFDKVWQKGLICNLQ